ncbi:MAG TPA: SDR family oxidoreductase [Verrucomicrobiae bacterium]|nr:SDR family oxidoreductase [Verrucomicrobiae bacterium]
MNRLRNKIAIVTGGAHGIGQAIAIAFAQEGATVFIADLDAKAGREAAAKICEEGGNAVFVQCDVSKISEVRQVVKRAAKNGRIDILCNNAAYIAKTWHAAGDAPGPEWKKCFDVSLLGTQHFTQAVLPIMLKAGAGSIINIASVQGLVAGRNSAAYTTVKHGLIGFTRSVACDYGARNVRCNAICPGAIKTRISPADGSELYQRQISKTFLGRVGEPREVAAAAVFLASDESSYITGAVLAVDGGWTAM